MNENEQIETRAKMDERLEASNYDRKLLCEMANKWKTETRLPMNIWIDENKTYRKRGQSKQIRFQLNDSCRMNIDDSGGMDLDGLIWPRNLDTRNLHQKQLAQLRNFVHNNRHALDKVADVLVPLFEIWPYMIKGGDIASDEEIQALNNKVDELMGKQMDA